MTKPTPAKPTYSLDAPDQKKLKIARAEIEAILQRYDLAGTVVLHTPGMSEWFYRITPSYSICWVDESAQILRFRSKLHEDYDGNAAAQLLDQAATANMTHCFAEELRRAADMFVAVDEVLSHKLGADHTSVGFVPDPNESKLN